MQQIKLHMRESFNETEATNKVLVLSMKDLTLEQLKQIPFTVVNELLKTRFPEDAMEKSYQVLHEALKKAVTSESMLSPLELVLKDDGLWIRVCGNENIMLLNEALKLGKLLHLNDRITHSLCPECYKKEKNRVMNLRNETRNNLDLSVNDS
jgi:hypothetical protein